MIEFVSRVNWVDWMVEVSEEEMLKEGRRESKN